MPQVHPVEDGGLVEEGEVGCVGGVLGHFLAGRESAAGEGEVSGSSASSPRKPPPASRQRRAASPKPTPSLPQPARYLDVGVDKVLGDPAEDPLLGGHLLRLGDGPRGLNAIAVVPDGNHTRRLAGGPDLHLGTVRHWGESGQGRAGPLNPPFSLPTGLGKCCSSDIEQGGSNGPSSPLRSRAF